MSAVEKGGGQSNVRNDSISQATATSNIRTSRSKKEKQLVDASGFAADPFNGTEHLAILLPEDTEESVQSVMRMLIAARDKSASELKRAVFRNHGEFLDISKLITNFGIELGEMKTLRLKMRESAKVLIEVADIGAKYDFEGDNKKREEDVTIITLAEKVKPTTTRVLPKNAAIENSRREKLVNLLESISDFEVHIEHFIIKF